jgi:hypothetical protein
VLPLLAAGQEVNPDSRLLAMDVDCDGRNDVVVKQGRELSVPVSSGLHPLGRLDEPLDESSIAVAPVAGAGFCQILAVAGGPEAVQVYALRDTGTGRKLVRLADVALEWGSVINLLFTDLNRDGKQDLLLQARTHSGFDGLVSYSAYGVGDGSFHSAAATLPAAQGDGLAHELLDGPRNHVLAAGDLDGDGGTDFFTAYGIQGAEMSQDASPPYEAARIADLTGDGRLDVAVNRGRGRDRTMEVWRNTTSGIGTPLVLESRGFATLHDSADLDGDGYADLLLSGTDEVLTQPRSASVLFAPIAFDQRKPTPLGDFALVKQMLAGDVYDPLADDGFTDVGLLYEARAGTLQLGFLSGSADRLLRSRIPVQGEVSSKDEQCMYRVPVLGRFRDPDLVDAAVLNGTAECQDLIVWSSYIGPSVRALELFSADAGGVASLGQSDLERDIDLRATGVALDSDGDGLDELYVIETILGPQPWALLELRWKEGPRWSVRELARMDELEQLSLEDASGDGRLDLVSSGGTWVVTAASPYGPGSLTELPIPDELDVCSWVQLDRDAERELVCAESYDVPGLRVFAAELKSGGLVESDFMGAPAGVQQMATADLNADGVDDLILLSSAEFSDRVLGVAFGVPSK